MKLSEKKGTEQSKKKSVGKAKKASEVIKVPGDWLYMTPQEIGVRQIYEAFGEQDGYELEIWEDAGVLEIGMSRTPASSQISRQHRSIQKTRLRLLLQQNIR